MRHVLASATFALGISVPSFFVPASAADRVPTPWTASGQTPAGKEEGNAAEEIGSGYIRFEDRAYILSTVVWEQRRIGVCWEADYADEQAKGWVRDAIARTWQKESQLVFVGWQKCAANAVGIRIKVSDEGPHTKGLGTQLNKKKDGMVLNFTFGRWSPICASSAMRERCIRTIAVHEFGHALAFAHEHNRPDRHPECRKNPQGTNGDVMLTPYDPESRMNYCNLDNEPVLSKGDILAVRALYGAPLP